jgi:flagellar hook-length control protein FliK
VRDAAAATAESRTDTAPAHGKDAADEASRGAAADNSRARPHRQDLTAGAGTNAVAAESRTDTAPAHGEDAADKTGCGAAADDSHTQPKRCSAANETEGQLVWALLAQIIQDLTAAADTNAVALADQGDAVASDHEEGDAVASDPEAGDAAEDLAALADLLKQLQESPAALTAEGAIPLDRLRQMLEKWQAGANESQPAGLPDRLRHLLKNIRDALPGIAWDRWASALARSDGAAGQVPLETAGPAGAAPVPAAGSQHDGLPADAGRAARGVLLDPKGTQAAAGKADAAVRADELSDRSRPAADERGPGAGRVLPASPPAAPPPPETLRSTAVSSKAQASEGSFVIPKNFEAEDTQSEVSDDSRSPAEKATAGLALAAADGVAEEGGSPGLRFEAALRDVRSFAMPEASPDKPPEAAAAAKGRDTAAAPVKTDVFDQIVQRAAVHVKNDQGEMRIDLKPEFLGHVRLQIVTDNQQVTVRILTELPMVRDMIESNIQQLKSDLQQQGLQVERVEVAVADDPRQHPGRQARAGAGRKGHADDEVAPAAAETGAGLRPEAAYRWGLGGQTTISMFA